MFKRVVWMGVGVAVGSAGTLWAERKVKDQLERVTDLATPQHVMELTRTRIFDVRDTVVAAVNEGRHARSDAESEMRQAVTDRWGRERPTG